MRTTLFTVIAMSVVMLWSESGFSDEKAAGPASLKTTTGKPPSITAGQDRGPGEMPKLLVAPFGASEARAARVAWARYRHVDDRRRNSIGIHLTLVPAGEFEMGSRVPDIETAIGFGYSITPATSVDVAYEHLFGDTVKINEATATGDLIVGTTHLSADIFAVQLTVRF